MKRYEHQTLCLAFGKSRSSWLLPQAEGIEIRGYKQPVPIVIGTPFVFILSPVVVGFGITKAVQIRGINKSRP